ncbi:hypothetical protein C1Y40_04147 [Mycobacterium talmoniae]|uniref:Uncharacterized protein n=1 Tax=Mycobacterium talmoniae TaxID=1858794 RepID=A0A2S8BGA5_9MYCO|nr:hypothetical protein C1Y40_04147 [Mycobacterium talmoniae]
MDTDWDLVFGEFEWLIENGMHATEACRHLGYRDAAVLGRAYHRQGRPLPRQLADECAWLKQMRAAS